MSSSVDQIERVRDAIAAMAEGRFVLVTDDADRENEADLVMAADAATPDAIAFLVRHTSGLICVPAPAERLAELEIPMMVATPSDTHDTAFTVSVDVIEGTTTGISSADRAATIRALADSSTKPADLARPGHIFPLRAVAGGVLERPGHTEAAVDLARLAGRTPVGVVCEVVADDGSMARGMDLERFAKEHDLPLISIADLVAYRKHVGDVTEGDPLPVSRRSTARLPTEHGTFQLIGYEGGGEEILAIVKGDVAGGGEPVLTRIHSECLTGDALGSLRCDCRHQLAAALRLIESEGRGVLLYMRGHEGRGVGLMGKIAAYALQDEGLDTVEANEQLGYAADGRDFALAAAVLYDLGVTSVRLLTNNPAKARGLEHGGIDVASRVPLVAPATVETTTYLQTKRDKLGHLIDLD